MAEGRDTTNAYNLRTRYPWFEIFRCFQVALDPRKLLVAAAGILVMSFAWWLLSYMFWYKAPSQTEPKYSTSAILKEFSDKNYTEEEAQRIGEKKYQADLAQWKELDSLAGPGGTFRTLPWYEYRGPNPYLLMMDLLSGSAGDRVTAFESFLSGTVPVLVEPLVKLLLPVAKLISPGVSAQTRFYLLLILACNIAVWAFCGGVITRIAAVQLANKGPISLKQAIQFVSKRYLGYLGAPAVPLAIIAAVILGLCVYGFLFVILPVVGDILLLGLALPVVIFGGVLMAVFLVGLVGYPLMYTTLSAEGDQSDTFDALSRSLNYVYQCPWSYIWYWLVAIVYGAAVTLFVLFFTSLAVYVGKWAVGLPASGIWSPREPDYLFIYAPESFGWRELLTKDSPYAVRGQWEILDKSGERQGEKADIGNERRVYVYYPVNKKEYDQERADYRIYNTWGAGFVCFWLTLIFLLVLGFTYSFFWSAATMIYLLMRKKVDESDLDEVFIEDEESPVAPAPPKLAEGTGVSASSPTSLPVISSPPAPATAPSPISVPDSPPASPPATIPFNASPGASEESKKDEPPNKME